MPRSRSSGALSIVSKERNVFFGLCFDSTFVIAAVNVVLRWSMCPIVPMFTCGFDRSNFALAIPVSCGGLAGTAARWALAAVLRDDLIGEVPGDFLVAEELHGVGGPSLCHGADVGGV